MLKNKSFHSKNQFVPKGYIINQIINNIIVFIWPHEPTKMKKMIYASYLIGHGNVALNAPRLRLWNKKYDFLFT